MATKAGDHITEIAMWRKSIKDYEVSSDGQVRNPDGRLLKPRVGKRGYYVISLWINGKHKTVTVHTLVCNAFHGPPPPGKDQVRHLNGVPADNHATNLRWGTAQEDADDRRRHGTTQYGEDTSSAVLTEAEVLRICERIDAGESTSDLGLEYGVSQSSISLINSGQRWGWLTGRNKTVEYEKQCPTCSKEFIASDRKAKYCSPSCRSEWNFQQMANRARADPSLINKTLRKRLKEFRDE